MEIEPEQGKDSSSAPWTSWLANSGKSPSPWEKTPRIWPSHDTPSGHENNSVASSPAMAKHILKTHDHVFAGRSVVDTAKVHSYHRFSIIWGEYGPQWRHLRRSSAVELFSPKRIEALQLLRRDHVFRTILIRLIFEDREKSVNIGHMAFYTSLNLLGNIIFSTTLFDPHNPASVGFKDAIWKLSKLGGTPNSVDFFSFLGFLDPQGLRRNMAKHLKGMHDLCDLFIQERLAAKGKNVEQNDSETDFLDVLLDCRSQGLTLVTIRVLIADLFIAGAETTATTIEWIMA